MKKLFLLMAAAAMVLASCVNERFENGVKLSKDDFGFNVSKVRTRSAEEVAKAGLSIPIKTDNAQFALEETISDMDDLIYGEPETRGVPVYTENLNDTYKTLGAVAYNEDGEEALGFETYVALETQVNGGWLYEHTYPNMYIWPENDGKLHFFLQMPADAAGVSYGDDAYDSANNTLSFSYISPLTGSEEKDILFSQKTLTESSYQTYFKGANKGAPVTMYHALTAVKFRTANDNTGDTKTIITGVKFKNLYKTGTCTIYPEGTEDPVAWTGYGQKGDFTQTFENTAHSPQKDVDNTVEQEEPE